MEKSSFNFPRINKGSNKVCVYLCVPLWVDSVADDTGAFLLAVVRQGGEDAVLPRLDGELQVGVRVKEHPLLQTHCLEV